IREMVLAVGQHRRVAVHGGGAGVDDPAHPRVAGGEKDVHGTGRVHGVGDPGIVHRARHRCDGRVVQDVVHPLHRSAAGIQVGNAAAHEADPPPYRRQVLTTAGREVVEHHDVV